MAERPEIWSYLKSWDLQQRKWKQFLGNKTGSQENIRSLVPHQPTHWPTSTRNRTEWVAGVAHNSQHPLAQTRVNQSMYKQVENTQPVSKYLFLWNISVRICGWLLAQYLPCQRRLVNASSWSIVFIDPEFVLAAHIIIFSQILKSCVW